jgi:hypothetical protein
MNVRTIYVHLKKSADFDQLAVFLNAYPSFRLERLSEHQAKIIDDLSADLVDYQHLREMIVQELLMDITAFVAPQDSDFPWETTLNVLAKLVPGIYSIESLIPEIVLNRFEHLKLDLKSYYYERCGSDVIDTVKGFVEHNQNASLSAKTLYMHRNTLNYRLENFVRKTEIDVHSFSGALAVYLLFFR